jgi:hypothetical protein
VAELETSTLPTPLELNVGQNAPFRQAHFREYATLSAGMVPQFTQIANVLGNPPWVARMWLRSNLVRMPSKNFLAIHQLDIHLCTEFPYTFYRQDYHARMVYR